MGPHVVSTRVIGAALVVLCGLGASSSLAGDAISCDVGPIRQWVAQRDGLPAATDVKIGPVTALRTPLLRHSHATQGVIVGAVAVGALGGLYGSAIGAWACEGSRGTCDEMLVLGAVGAAGGALVGGAVGGLIGSLFRADASASPRPSHARTRLNLLPRRGGGGIAVSHSF
jgi:hypothetical protein